MEPTPVDPADRTMGRRRFIKVLLGFSLVSTLAMVVTPIAGFLIPPKSVGANAGGRVLAATTTDLPVGAGKVVAMGSKPVILVNTQAAGVKAFSAVCTHLGCIVAYDPTSSAIVCPCHDGHFNPANGSVTSGPPPQPLAPVGVAVEKDQIFLVSS
jgi:cytochrome b6-f complex iron-sulfur subunit